MAPKLVLAAHGISRARAAGNCGGYCLLPRAAGGEGPDVEVAVEEHRGNLRALEQTMSALARLSWSTCARSSTIAVLICAGVMAGGSPSHFLDVPPPSVLFAEAMALSLTRSERERGAFLDRIPLSLSRRRSGLEVPQRESQ
jgi:hypothetical protein